MLNAKRLAIISVVVLSAAINAAQAQSWARLGAEFQSNTYTTDHQDSPSVATDAIGNFVVVWQSRPRGEGGGQDGDYSGIFGQRFTSAGADVGTEFQINTYTTNSQFSPDVAETPDGRFVVVWGSYDQDGYYGGIFAQRYDSTGVAAGTEFQVNTYTTYSQRAARVATYPSGNFVVVWASYQQDGVQSGIFAQRFDSSGGQLGTEFQVNSVSSGDQIAPDVAVDTGGRFVIVWNTAYPDRRVFGRRFDSSGVPLGTEFELSDLEGVQQSYPAVAADTSNGFVVAWQAALGPALSVGPTVFDDDNLSIQARRFNSAGAPIGSQFQVNTYTTGKQAYPAVATAPSGDFVVVWQSGAYYGAEQDGSYAGIFGQRFSGNGSFLGTEFLVNTYTTYGQQYPAIAAGPNDFFVVVWQSNAEGGDFLVTGGAAPQMGPRDPNLFGVFGQRFGAATVPGTAPALSPMAIVFLAVALCAIGAASLVRRRRA